MSRKRRTERPTATRGPGRRETVGVGRVRANRTQEPGASGSAGRPLAERSLARRPKQQSTNALPQLLSVPFRAFTSDNPAQQSPARLIRTPRPRRYLSPATLFPSPPPLPPAPAVRGCFRGPAAVRASSMPPATELSARVDVRRRARGRARDGKARAAVITVWGTL